MTPIICAKPSPPRARSPLFPTTRHGRSNIRSTNISMPSAISWNAASQSSSSSGASQRASRKPLGTIRPWSPLPLSSYGCDKCPQDLQLRLVACLDLGLGFRLAQLSLVVDDLADAGEARSLDPRIRRPQARAHQCLAAM